jgi:hypothetical protein
MGVRASAGDARRASPATSRRSVTESTPMKLATLLRRVAITPGHWEFGRADYLVRPFDETPGRVWVSPFLRAVMVSAEIGPV